MGERVIGLGELMDHLPDRPWILIFGGVSREGNRRARRAIRSLLEGTEVAIWFDGYSERPEVGETRERVPLDVPVPDGRVLVVDYAAVERNHWLNRVVGSLPDAVVRPLARAENQISDVSSERVSVLTLTRRAFGRVAASLHKKVLRRFSLIFAGRVSWKILRPTVAQLAEMASPPEQIIYGDDTAMTPAWHAARIWPDARTAMEYHGA